MVAAIDTFSLGLATSKHSSTFLWKKNINYLLYILPSDELITIVHEWFAELITIVHEWFAELITIVHEWFAEHITIVHDWFVAREVVVTRVNNNSIVSGNIIILVRL